MISFEKTAAKRSLLTRIIKGRKKTRKERLGALIQSTAANKSQNRYATDILAHELGHAKAFSKSGPKVRAVRKGLYSHAGDIAQGINTLKAAPFGKASAKKALIQAAGEAPKLAEEAAASLYALKYMKKLKYISPTHYKKARNNLARAFGSYALVAGGRVAGAGLGPTRFSGKFGQGAAIEAGGKAGGAIAGALISGFKSGQSVLAGGRGGVSTMRQAKALSKKMGVNPLIIPSSKTRMSENAFQMAGKDVGALGGLLALKKKEIGKRGMRKALRDGVVSTPRMRLSEAVGQKKGLREALLGKVEQLGRNLQGMKKQSSAALASFGGLLAGEAIGTALGKRKVKQLMAKSLKNRIRLTLDKGLQREIINTYAGRSSVVGSLTLPQAVRLRGLLAPIKRADSVSKPASNPLSDMFGVDRAAADRMLAGFEKTRKPRSGPLPPPSYRASPGKTQ
jgi:hypothetical protein